MIPSLSELQALALDCQATGPNPAKGHLLEIGWVKTRAAAGARVKDRAARSCLVCLPDNAAIPAAVQRVTGICGTALEKAQPAADIWQEVVATAHRLAAANQMAACPTLVHYARYEEPFLKDLHAASGLDEAFPLQVICTHEIIRRLLPGLPRKGLRAAAGYFGHALPAHRRSGVHAVATAVVWQHLVQMLGVQHRIENWAQLAHWLDHTPLKCAPSRQYPMKLEVRLDLPQKPGIYRMRRANGDLLYIGKAASLKNRVNSYFRPKGPRAEHILEMLSQARDLDVTLTGSALEAAILESDEIKRQAPPYNIALQKGRRKLVFCSRDLLEAAGQADSIHCIGPLPDRSIAAALGAFADWCNNHPTPAVPARGPIQPIILGLPEAYAPPADCLEAGLGLFRRRHSAFFDDTAPLRVVTGLGLKLWRDRLAELKATPSQVASNGMDAEASDEAPQSQTEPAWTPETVAAAMEKCIMRSALLIRRSRWLCLLSESTLAWEERRGKSRGKIFLVFESGAVGRRGQLPDAQKVPPPPGHARRLPLRQKIFGLATYERLRVVSTELRRLLTEGRHIEIRLSPSAVINPKHLANILPWV